MAKATSVQKDSPSQTVSALVEISELDTLYRDIYFTRARRLMDGIMSYASYTYIKDGLASLGLVERQLRAAVQRGDWERTTELTQRVRAIKQSGERGEAINLAEAVYDRLADIPIDPFASGFYAFLNRSAEAVDQLRNHAIRVLSTLESTDASNKDFYARRRADFQTLTIGAQIEKKEETATKSSVDLRNEALQAVDAGDLSQLEKLVERLKEKPEAEESDEQTVAVELAETGKLGDDMLYTFSDETLEAAGKLGLTPVRTTSRRNFAYLMPYRWHPSFLKSEGKRWAQDQVARLTHPVQTSDPAREAIELYLFNPFINSGGTRYEVNLVIEDLLIEDFAEPKPGTAMPRTELLAELGLKSRWGLTRREIEKALFENGPRIVSEKLALDPQSFRIVAMPPDIYTNLGPDRGWGQQEMWTHFDGYWVREGGKLHALAGGDKRFGGTHDVLSFDPIYASEKVLARFAVVQRKRMTSWQKG